MPGIPMTKARPARRLRAARAKRFSRSLGGSLVLGVLLGIMGIFMVLPLVYAVVSAFKPPEEFFIFPPRFYVVNPTLDNFSSLLDLTGNLWVPFTRYLFNSVFVSITGTLGHVLLSSTAAYVLCKHRFKGRQVLLSMIVVSLMFTSKIMGIPQYLVTAKFGFIDTYMALIAPVLGMTLGVFLMKQFMEGVPDAIIESARIDGAGELRICWRIVMPAVRPAWITLVIFAFQNIWNSTGGNMIYSEQLKVLPTVMTQIAATGMTRAGVGAAVSLLLMIPPIVVFVISQSSIVETMASFGIKE